MTGERRRGTRAREIRTQRYRTVFAREQWFSQHMCMVYMYEFNNRLDAFLVAGADPFRKLIDAF